MDIKDLRYFLAIVEEGSLSRAAVRLHVAQPALSIRVKKMEEALDTALLTRGARGVAPTGAGELLARRAHGLIAGLARTADEVRSLGRDPAGTVRIGLPGTISGMLAVPLIARMRRRFPRIKIIIAEAMSGFVRDWLRDGQADLAVLYGELREAGLRSELLLREELVALLPPGTPSDGTRPVEALAEMPLILPSGAHGLRKMIAECLQGRGLVLDPLIEVDSYASIKTLVAGGYGCSVLPYHTVAAEAAAGALVVEHLRGPALWRSVYLAHPSAQPLTLAADAVSGLLKEVADDLIATGVWAGAQRAGLPVQA